MSKPWISKMLSAKKEGRGVIMKYRVCSIAFITIQLVCFAFLFCIDISSIKDIFDFVYSIPTKIKNENSIIMLCGVVVFMLWEFCLKHPEKCNYIVNITDENRIVQYKHVKFAIQRIQCLCSLLMMLMTINIVLEIFSVYSWVLTIITLIMYILIILVLLCTFKAVSKMKSIG